MPPRRRTAGETRELQKLGKICGEPFFLSPPFSGPADCINLDGLILAAREDRKYCVLGRGRETARMGEARSDSMTFRTLGCWLAMSAMLVNGAAPVLAQAPVPPPPPATLWSFLGIPQAFKAVREGAINKSGNHPKLEKKPPLKKIADPANLLSENPAIKKAAEIKKEEDLKWQKIKAIKYLTTIGCGCYNRDGSITDALMKAMDDCTEEVRYATILAINGAAGGEMCENCKMRSCCSEEVSNKLYEIAYERDDEGCFLEPSERVRLAAAEAIRVCCPGSGDDFFFEGAPIGEGPRPYEGEMPGGLQPGSERPIEPPPPAPREPTPAIPLPPVPTTSSMRPISESAPQRHEMTRQEAPRTAALPQPAVSRPLPAPIAPPAAPATTQPVPTAPAQPRSSRRTANLPNAPQATAVAASEIAAEKVGGSASKVPATVASLPFASATPHWSVGSKAPTVFISQPIAPAKPIDSSRATAPVGKAETSAPPAELRQASATTPVPANAAAKEAEHLAPIVPASAMRRLPPTDDAPQPTASSQPLAQPAKFVSRRLPAITSDAPAKPIAASKQRAGQRRELPGEKFGAGTVGSVRLRDGVAMVEFDSNESVPPGSIIRTYHAYAFADKKAAGDLEVIRSEGNVAIGVPYNGCQLSSLTVGDQAIVLR
jgi:hypothetical protein